MTEIRFYHLQKKTVESVAFDLIDRARARYPRILIRVKDDADAQRLNDFFWTYRADSFLPHATSSDKRADQQPVLITATSDNANNATMVVLMPGAETNAIDDYALVCDMLDGRDEDQILAGRARYKDWRAQGHSLSYWQQSEAGKWEQKS